jgi:hypothetical protein
MLSVCHCGYGCIEWINFSKDDIKMSVFFEVILSQEKTVSKEKIRWLKLYLSFDINRLLHIQLLLESRNYTLCHTYFVHKDRYPLLYMP